MRSPPTEETAPLQWEGIFDPGGHPGAVNMAIDAALLAEAARTGRAFLRLYRFDPPCLSLGRNEPAATRYDRAAIARRRLDVVRRPTGGRAVWHEHEVTYAVAAPITTFGGLRPAYYTLHTRRGYGARLRPPSLACHRPRPPRCLLRGPGWR